MWMLRSPCAVTTSICLFSRSPRCASITTVRLWHAWMRSDLYPSFFIGRITPSSCHGVGARLVDDVLVPSQVHQPVVVLEDGGRFRFDDGDDGLGHGRYFRARG